MSEEPSIRQLTILGATGSIGKSTLDVISQISEGIRLFAVTANQNVDALFQICAKHLPKHAVIADERFYQQFKAKIDESPVTKDQVQVHTGSQALCEVSSHEEVDVVMAAIVGGAGLLPSLAAARSGKRILLANKEALVMAGQLFLKEVRASGAELLPVDSEHNAIFQCLPKNMASDNGVEKLILTASGGAFRERPLETFQQITVAEACAHPNWEMGKKITVDSATMMNKGLELIEASLLFDTPESNIEIVLHPESIIHSLVGYVDGSLLAQLGHPDMRIPIAHAMHYPYRKPSGVSLLDIAQVGRLNFEAPSYERYPALSISREACRLGQPAQIALNASNEVVVEAFLSGKIAFPAIAAIVEDVLGQVDYPAVSNLEEILDWDNHIRRETVRRVEQRRTHWTI